MRKHDISKSPLKPEEQLLTAKATDTAFLCLKKQTQMFTDFLDPKSVKLVMGLRISGVSICKNGGADECERAVVCFFPAGLCYETSDISFPIKTLYIDSSKFVNSLTHRDFLGSLIGLGIDRGKIGDIFVDNGNATVFVREEIADFIVSNLESVGRVKVKVKETDSFLRTEKNAVTRRVTVPSMRVDVILSEAFNLSRKKSLDMINAEKVFVNWELSDSASKTIKEGDVISARGLGRVVLSSISGISKKGRFIVELEVF